MKGKEIHLRALEPRDIEVLFEWENNMEVWKISDTLFPFSRYALQKFISSDQDIYTQCQWRLIIEGKKGVLGCVDLFDFDPVNCRVGVGILIADESERRKGYAREAIGLIVNHAFEYLNCHQVFCNITEDNEASLKLFESCGFVKVGLKKDWIRQGATFKSEYLLQRMRG